MDALDEACAVHDCCLFGPWDVCTKYSACNAALCKAANAVNCDAEHPNDEAQAYQCNKMKQTINLVFC